jgi:hypothetical protein
MVPLEFLPLSGHRVRQLAAMTLFLSQHTLAPNTGFHGHLGDNGAGNGIFQAKRNEVGSTRLPPMWQVAFINAERAFLIETSKPGRNRYWIRQSHMRARRTDFQVRSS